MTTLTLYQVDAFARRTFEGNPAAVCPLDVWLDDGLLLKIAEENNLSETAFFVAQGETFSLRWFTPEAEVDLCGHATLAAAHVLFSHLGYTQPQIRFMTRSGELVVQRTDAGYRMDFPAAMPVLVSAPSELTEALGVTPESVLAAFDYVVVLEHEEQLKALTPDYSLLAKLDLRGVVVTAPSREVDFVSRCFFPKLRINEDPVTGSAQCELAPYWQQRLGKDRLVARQISSRGGDILCEIAGDRVVLTGMAADYLKGQIQLPD